MKNSEIEKLHHLGEDNWWFHAKDAFLIKKLQPYRIAGKILDVGCCSGRFLRKFIDSRSEMLTGFGIDPSETAIELGAHDDDVTLQVGRAEAIAFEDEQFDLLIASDVLEHVPDDHAVVREFHRVLGPGGRCAITVPAYQWLWSSHDENLDHKRRYNRPQLVSVLVDHGFAVEESGYCFGFVFPLFVVSRVLDKARGRLGRRRKESSHQSSSAFLNRVLGWVCALERRLFALPFGSTVYCIAKKA